jgi:hypothetical protein
VLVPEAFADRRANATRTSRHESYSASELLAAAAPWGVLFFGVQAGHETSPPASRRRAPRCTAHDHAARIGQTAEPMTSVDMACVSLEVAWALDEHSLRLAPTIRDREIAVIMSSIR